MATNHSGAEYFMLQARTIAEHSNVNRALFIEDARHSRGAQAPYKGMKSTTSAVKVLNAKVGRHNDDLKRLQTSLSNTRPTPKIGVPCHVIIQLIKGDSFPKQTIPGTKVHFESSLPTITEESPSHKCNTIKFHVPRPLAAVKEPPKHNLTTIKFRVPRPLAVVKEAPKDNLNTIKFRAPRPGRNIPRLRVTRNHFSKLRFPLPRPSRNIIKFKVPSAKKLVTTENNGVFRRIRFRISNPADRYPRAFMQELIIRLNNKYPTWDPMEIDTIYPKTDESLHAELKLNNKYYNITAYLPPSFPREKTAEPEKQRELDFAPEHFKIMDTRDKKKKITPKTVTRGPKCGYFKSLNAEKKNPGLTPSQVDKIRQRHSPLTSLPGQVEEFPKKAHILCYDRKDQTLSKKAAVAYRNAEKALDKRSEVANLIRANAGKPINDVHALSALPLQMRFHNHDGIRGGGRIEHGRERSWCSPAVAQLRKKDDVPNRWKSIGEDKVSHGYSLRSTSR